MYACFYCRVNPFSSTFATNIYFNFDVKETRIDWEGEYDVLKYSVLQRGNKILPRQCGPPWPRLVMVGGGSLS